MELLRENNRLTGKKHKKSEREKLLSKYTEKMQINADLDRSLVSFQANKRNPIFRWVKYREGFSSDLVGYIIDKLKIEQGTILDPFAGSGTTLFESQRRGFEAQGIELLPVGTFIINSKLAVDELDTAELALAIKQLKKVKFNSHDSKDWRFTHINITKSAFSAKTEKSIAGYLSYLNKHFLDQPLLMQTLKFALFAILEDISFTRKDGQFIRWDKRSGRASEASTFSKGEIPTFESAIFVKLEQILNDLTNAKDNRADLLDFIESKSCENKKDIKIYEGSSLYLLPKFERQSIDCILTSPPYCNRYDYTRTYALELAFLGKNDDEVKALRQSLLSCTVENRDKLKDLAKFYQEIGRIDTFNNVIECIDSQPALLEILNLLDQGAKSGELNNPNIAKMVRNYFFEMSFMIAEFARILKKGGKVVMVNDNVQYLGEEVPVDLLLSEIATFFGLSTDVIWVLPKGKGNSSQQMGKHGRRELRKCVYVWSKK